MKLFKLILKEIKQENEWGYKDKDEVKLGEVAFDFTGKVDEVEVQFKKGDKVYYQYGTEAILDGENYVLVSLNSLVCLK